MDSLTIPARSAKGEAAFAVLGRAIAVACSFEEDCRLLALKLQLKGPRQLIEDPVAFEKLIRHASIAIMGETHKQILRLLSKALPFEDVLTDAREARNGLAHDAGRNLDSIVENQEKLAEWMNGVREQLRRVAVGKQVVSVFAASDSSGVWPTKEELLAYPKGIEQWVFAQSA
jgi:hypothetical protein